MEAADHYKCGFPAILQIESSQQSGLKKQFKAWQTNRIPLEDIYISPSGHFQISYSTSGFHAVPGYDRNSDQIPDYVEFVGQSFDHAWRIEIDSLGFNPPLDLYGQPKSVYNVDIRSISGYGLTYLDDEITSLPGINYDTHIELNEDYDFVNYPNANNDFGYCRYCRT